MGTMVRRVRSLLGGTAALLGARQLRGISLAGALVREDTGDTAQGDVFWLDKERIYLGGIPHTTPKQEDLIYSFLKDANGRRRLAEAMGPSLRRRRDYMSLARKALCVVDGGHVSSLGRLNLHSALPLSSGVRFPCLTGHLHSTGDGIDVPTFEIASKVGFPVSHVAERRFDLVARGLNLSKGEVTHAEDEWMFALMDATARDIIPFSPSFLEETRERFSLRGIKEAQYIFAHPHDTTELLKLRDERLYHNQQWTTLKTGLLGDIDGVLLYQSRAVPQGWMYLTGHTKATRTVDGVDDAVYAGYVADEERLSVLSADLPPDHMYFTLTEKVGLAVNPDAVQLVCMGGTGGTRRTRRPRSTRRIRTARPSGAAGGTAWGGP
jgi:hypothetical protein